jgi:aminomethyltransferase
VVVNA